MTREQKAERLSDAEVGDKVLGLWDEVNAWHRRLGVRWWPTEGSDLHSDNETATGFTPSHLAWTSLGIGTDCMLTACAYALNFGPTLFSMHPLLRTAMFGGAQGVWLLSPDDQTTRLERAEQLDRDSHWNHKQWAEEMDGAHPESVDPDKLAADREVLAGLVGDKRLAEVFQTRVIRRAAEYVYSSPPDPQMVQDCVGVWRAASGVAHALPWEQSMRPNRIRVEEDGVRTTVIAASWSEVQGEFGIAYAFLETGWRLLDRRGGTAPPE